MDSSNLIIKSLLLKNILNKLQFEVLKWVSRLLYKIMARSNLTVELVANAAIRHLEVIKAKSEVVNTVFS